MTFAEPDAESQAPPPPPAPTQSAPPQAGSPDRVLGGVAGLIAARLGVDPLWVRLGFVVLALAGGIGVIVYVALWLIFIAGAAPNRAVFRAFGGIVLLVGLPLLLDSHRSRFITGTGAVVALLVGLALALWRPPAAASVIASSAPAPPASSGQFEAAPAPVAAAVRREPSLLGRATLGLAVSVAAIGALIDLANGGRLHPEQWLGVAAALCGVGLLAGTMVGRARWLVFPAIGLTFAGFVGGVAARVGTRVTELGDRHLYIGDGSRGGTETESVTIGTITATIDGVPRGGAALKARAGVGDVKLFVSDDVTVEIRSRIDHGDLFVDGVEKDNDATVRVGPEGDPDVVVTARVGYGNVHVETFDRGEIYAPKLPIVPTLPERPLTDGQLLPVADGVSVSESGWIVLGNGSAVIDSNDRLVAGETFEVDANTTYIETEFGQFRLLPGSLLLTPDGTVLDLNAIRGSIGSTPKTAPASGATSTVVAPTETPATPTITAAPAAPASPSTIVPNTTTTTGG